MCDFLEGSARPRNENNPSSSCKHVDGKQHSHLMLCLLLVRLHRLLCAVSDVAFGAENLGNRLWFFLAEFVRRRKSIGYVCVLPPSILINKSK